MTPWWFPKNTHKLCKARATSPIPYPLYKFLGSAKRSLSSASKIVSLTELSFRCPNWARCGPTVFWISGSEASSALPASVQRVSRLVPSRDSDIKFEDGHTKTLVLPNIGLHADSMERMFPKEGQPSLNCLRISILDLDKTAECNPLKVLLALLVDKVTTSYSPAFDDTRKRHGSGDREAEVVRGTEGEVSEELQVLHTVGSQLEVANGEAVFRLPPERTQVQRLDAARESGVFTQSS